MLSVVFGRTPQLFFVQIVTLNIKINISVSMIVCCQIFFDVLVVWLCWIYIFKHSSLYSVLAIFHHMASSVACVGFEGPESLTLWNNSSILFLIMHHLALFFFWMIISKRHIQRPCECPVTVWDIPIGNFMFLIPNFHRLKVPYCLSVLIMTRTERLGIQN